MGSNSAKLARPVAWAAVRWCWPAVAALVLAGGCAQLPERPALPAEYALPPGEGAGMDAEIAAAEAGHPGESGFRLVSEGQEAFVFRERSALRATRSLDVQTYIWHEDETGLFLAWRLLEAADRGVRVRVLMDDMDARPKNAGFGALAAHPNIQVRLFNPFASREGFLGLVSEGITDFHRINRRMHNKTWIADNRIALAGGRNLGDEYFSADEEVNFVDLDVAMIGPVVREASASFDRYWNAPVTYPMEVLDPATVTAERLARLRALLEAQAGKAAQGRYARALRGDDAIRRLAQGQISLEWSRRWVFAADDPDKVRGGADPERPSAVLAVVGPAMEAARRELTVLSPYFVPGPRATGSFVQAVEDGRNIRILTNSLAANDVAAVHGGYSRYRLALVQGGVQLWELKPVATGRTRSSFTGSSGASLHTKAFSVDGTTLFVGSFNLDPRSAFLNTEQGVLVDNAELARQLETIFATQTAGERAWRVTAEGDELRWSDGRQTVDHEPGASAGQRFQAWLARVLGVEAQL